MSNRNNMKFVLAASTLLSPFLAAPAMAQVQDIIVADERPCIPQAEIRMIDAVRKSLRRFRMDVLAHGFVL